MKPRASNTAVYAEALVMSHEVIKGTYRDKVVD